MGVMRILKISIFLIFQISIHSQLYAYRVDQDSIPVNNKLYIQEVKIKADPAFYTRNQIQPTEKLNEEFFKKFYAGSFSETISQVSGVHFIGIGSSQSSPIIRGLAFNRVIVVDNGIKHQAQQWGADHGLEVDQYTVGEVELVKGPQSYAYGSDGIGGMILLKPKWNSSNTEKNTSVWESSLRFKSINSGYGSTVSYFENRDKWYYGGLISINQYADYRVPSDTVHVYGYPISLDKNKVRNSAGNDLSLKTELGFENNIVNSHFSISYYAQKAGFFANAHGILPINVDKNLYDASNRDILNPHQNVKHFKILNKQSYKIQDDELEIDLGFQINDRNEYNIYYPHGYMPVQLPSLFNGREELERKYKKWTLSANLKYKRQYDNHKIQYGGNVEYQNNEIGGWGFLIPAYKQITGGLFIHDSYRTGPHTKIISSVRYDAAKIQTKFYEDWFPSYLSFNPEQHLQDSVHVLRSRNLSKTFSSWIGAVGIHHAWGNFDFKAHLGKSFRLPIAKELSSNGVNYHTFSFEVGNTELKPESAYQFDLGLSYTRNNFNILITPFFNHFTNYIYLNPTSEIEFLYGAGNQIYRFEQNQVRQLGLETSLNWDFAPDFSLSSQFDKVHSVQIDGLKKGYSLPFSPSSKLNSAITWSASKVGAFNRPYISIHHLWSARQDRIVPPESPTSSYNLFHIRGGVSLTQFSFPLDFSLQIQNIFNKKYFDHTSYYKIINLPEKGLNLSITVSAKVFKHLK